MDAGVGAAGGMDSDQAAVGAGTADGGDGGFDGILDGGASALTLPSSEGAYRMGGVQPIKIDAFRWAPRRHRGGI